MKKKLLSILLAGILLTGLTLNAESFAAPKDHRGPAQHKEMRHNQHKQPVKFNKKGPDKHHKNFKKANDKKKFANHKSNSRFEHKKDHKKFHQTKKVNHKRPVNHHKKPGRR